MGKKEGINLNNVFRGSFLVPVLRMDCGESRAGSQEMR